VQAIGWAGLALGVVLILVSFFAADLGLGGTTFGPKHIITLVAGIVLVVAGAFVAWRQSKAPPRNPDGEGPIGGSTQASSPR